ncbi:MAG: hypothetical protein Q9213_002216 [Squamulea squamosa]
MSAEQTIFVARQCNEYGTCPRDEDSSRFGFSAMIPDPLAKPQAALEDIAYSLDHLHADGICLLTRYGSGNAYLGHEEYRPIWDALDARKAVVFVHPSQPADPNLVNPALVAPIIDYPYIAISCAPRRGYSSSHLEGMGRPLKTTEQIFEELKSFYFNVGLGSGDLVLPFLLKFAKLGHVLLGSDLPYALRPTVDFFTGDLDEFEKGLSEEKSFAIDQGNALELFPRLKSLTPTGSNGTIENGEEKDAEK